MRRGVTTVPYIWNIVIDYYTYSWVQNHGPNCEPCELFTTNKHTKIRSWKLTRCWSWFHDFQVGERNSGVGSDTDTCFFMVKPPTYTQKGKWGRGGVCTLHFNINMLWLWGGWWRRGGLRLRVPFTFGACINPFSTGRLNVQSGTTDAWASSCVPVVVLLERYTNHFCFPFLLVRRAWIIHIYFPLRTVQFSDRGVGSTFTTGESCTQANKNGR